MPIVDLQHRLVQLGRIRTGQRVATADGSRPKALDKFRLTSPYRVHLDQAAQLWGGDVRPFKADRSADRWELFTDTNALPVMVLPPVSPGQQVVSQWYELWGGGGCVRRCDGEIATLVDGHRGDQDCVCDPDDRDCSPHTRLTIVLPDLDAFGTWRLDTQGWNAANELGAAAALLARATSLGWSVPAVLHLVERPWSGLIYNEKKKKTEAVNRQFVVPVLVADVSPESAMQIAQGRPYTPPELAGAPTALPRPTPVAIGPAAPRALDPAHPAVREQKRRRTVRPADEVIPDTGTEPETHETGKAAETEAENELDAARRRAATRDPKAGFRFIDRLPPEFQGDEGKPLRHALYDLAHGARDAQQADLPQSELNAVMRWSQWVHAHTHEIRWADDDGAVSLWQLQPEVLLVREVK